MVMSLWYMSPIKVTYIIKRPVKLIIQFHRPFTFINDLPYLTVDLSYIPFGIALIPAIRFEYCSLSFEFSAY